MSKKEILAWIYYYGLLEITIDHLDDETLRNCAMLATDGILSGYHYLTTEFLTCTSINLIPAGASRSILQIFTRSWRRVSQQTLAGV